VSSFKWNFISISSLEKFCYCCSFGNERYSLFHDLKFLGYGSLSSYDNFYSIYVIASFNELLQLNTWGINIKLTNYNING